MKRLKSTAQTKYDLRYHFVFCPKYRKRVLSGKIAKTIEGMIRFCCQVNQWEIYELAVQQDHIHLFMSSPPKFSPSRVMKLVKGGTARKIKQKFPELHEIYWGAGFWADGYLVKSVGEMTDKVVSNYVKNQSNINK